MIPHTHIEIDFKALENNLKLIKQKAGNKKIQGVVKANAYGHGDFEIARALERLGVANLGVARVNEGVRLRELGITSEILVLGGAEENEFEPLINHKLKPVIYNEGIAEKLNDYLKFRDLKHQVHIKIDTGMHRLGIAHDKTEKFFNELKGYTNLEPEGIMSHFVAAGAKEAEWNVLQTERFKDALTNWKKIFKEAPKNIHIENSAGFFNFNLDFTNTVRLGIAIYGYGYAGLLPVLKLYSSVKDIKDVKKGETVSYGGWFRAQSDMKIAVVPVGYGDGFMRAGRKGSVMVNGEEAPIVSIICMDYFMIDVTNINGIKIGDQVTIIGDTHDAGYWAKTSGTIVYEVLTLLNPRIRRKYNGA